MGLTEKNAHLLTRGEIERFETKYKKDHPDFFLAPLDASSIAEAASNWVNKETLEQTLRKVVQHARKYEIPPKKFSSNPLQERTEQLEEVASVIKSNLNRISLPTQQINTKAKTDLIIPTFTGGSGIGKTTLGYESAQYVFKHWNQIAPQYADAKLLYFLMDFSNGCKLTDLEREYCSPNIIVGLRLAFAYFVENKYVMNYAEFVHSCGESWKFFKMTDVVECIRKDLGLQLNQRLFIIVHIDEVQFIFAEEAGYKGQDPQSKGLFKLLIYQICTFFGIGQTIIQPFVCGTATQEVMLSKEPSMYTFQYIKMPLLSLGAVINLVEYYATQFGANEEWKLNLPFLQLLGDMGGLPRAVSYLLDKCFGEERSNGDFFKNISNIQFYPLFIQIADLISNKYGIEGFIYKNKEAAMQVVEYAIRAYPIRRDMILNGGKSIAQMELGGHVFLEVTPDGLLLFRMPFLFLHIYNQHLQVIPSQLGSTFNHDEKVSWQDWEQFNAMYEVFMNNFYVKHGLQTIKLGDFFWGSQGTEKTKDLEVKLNPIQLVPVLHQFPSLNQPVLDKNKGSQIDWKTNKYLLLNGKCASFADTVSFRYVADATQSLQFFGREIETIITAGQEKWDYNGKDITLVKIKQEHEKNIQTANVLPNTYGIITICFTSQRLDETELKNIPDGILVVDQQNFKKYYGPFATRAAFAIAQHLNPNFADIKHLQALKGIGETTAQNIVTNRKRPYTDMDDFCTKNSLDKTKISRQLSFFPFKSRKLLIPFEDYPEKKQ